MLSILRTDPKGSKITPAEGENLGYWIYSPIDADILYRGYGEFEMKRYSDSNPKFIFGRPEENSLRVQIGCVLMARESCSNLLIKNPSNSAPRIISIREEIISNSSATDLWIEIRFSSKDRWAAFRRNSGPPIAQILPLPDQAFSKEISEAVVNPERLIGFSSKPVAAAADPAGIKKIGNQLIFSGDTLRSATAS